MNYFFQNHLSLIEEKNQLPKLLKIISGLLVGFLIVLFIPILGYTFYNFFNFKFFLGILFLFIDFFSIYLIFFFWSNNWEKIINQQILFLKNNLQIDLLKSYVNSCSNNQNFEKIRLSFEKNHLNFYQKIEIIENILELEKKYFLKQYKN